MREARTIHLLRVKLADSLCLATDAGCELAPALESMIQHLDKRARSSLGRFPEPPVAWCTAECQLAAHITGLILESLESFPHIGAAYTAFGLSTHAVLSPKDAQGLVRSALERFARSGHPELDHEVLGYIAKKTNRSPESLASCRTEADLARTLSARHVDRTLAELAATIEESLPLSFAYANQYRSSLAVHERANESGEYAQAARKAAAKASAEDLQIYNLGRLPGWHVQKLARRDTTRKFLKDVWDRLPMVQTGERFGEHQRLMRQPEESC